MSDNDKPTANNVVFKKFNRANRVLKRKASSAESDSSGSDKGAEIVKRDRKKRVNPLKQSTSRSNKHKAANDGSTSSSSDGEAAERQRLLGISTYESSKSAARAGPSDGGATSTNQVDTEFGNDAQTQFERAQEAMKERMTKGDDKTYKGLAAYGGFVEKQDTALGKASSGYVRKGPIRAPNFVRQSVLWDYKIDLCKDYKETGYCTFGDSCKFLHDRTDYKHGWELERDFNNGELSKPAENLEISDDEDVLPFKCLICRESFTNPVITKCKHYFCESCALAQYRKTQKCYACETNTGGVFNPAKEIIARMAGEKTKKQKRKDDASDSGLSDDNEKKEENEDAEKDGETDGIDIEMGVEEQDDENDDGDNDDDDK